MTPEQQKALAIARARRRRQEQAAQAPAAQQNPDGTYGQPPEGYFQNPHTGQMTSRENLRASMEPSSATGAFARGMGQGVTFGLTDELGSALAGDEQERNFQRELDRARLERDGEDSFAASIGGNIAGAAIPAIASAPIALGKSLLGTMARGAGIGAIEGAAHGAGQGEGAEGRAQGAAWGGSMGALAGGVAPAAVRGVQAVGRGIADPASGIIDHLLNRGNTTKANRAVLESLRQSGRSVDDVGADISRAAAEGQPEFRLMDALGNAGQRRASGIVRAGGDSATELAEYLEKRQLGQPERVAGFIEDAYGFRGQGAPGTDIVPQGQTFVDRPVDVLRRPARSAASLTDDLTKARGAAANEAYDAARGNAAPVDVRGALSAIDNRIGGMQGSGVAGDSIDAKLAGYRARLAADAADLSDGTTARELSDFDRVLGVKQALQDDIGAAVRAGRNNEARELRKVVSALDEALEGASPSYRAANDEFAKASGVIDAVGEGTQMARPGNRATDTTARFSAMAPDQQAAARVGYGDSLLQRLEANAAPTTNRAKPLQSPKVEAERGAMALDPELLGRRVDRENAMWATQNRALGGSRTADNLADIEAAQGVTGGLVEAGRAAANFQVGDALMRAGQALGPLARGENEATRALIVRSLLAGNPKEVLEAATKQKLSGDVRDSILAALLRDPSRRAITP